MPYYLHIYCGGQHSSVSLKGFSNLASLLYKLLQATNTAPEESCFLSERTFHQAGSWLTTETLVVEESAEGQSSRSVCDAVLGERTEEKPPFLN